MAFLKNLAANVATGGLYGAYQAGKNAYQNIKEGDYLGAAAQGVGATTIGAGAPVVHEGANVVSGDSEISLSGIADALGLSGPKTGQLEQDIAAQRSLAGAAGSRALAAGPRDVPQVTAQQAAAYGVDAPTIAGVQDVTAPTIGPAERASFARVQRGEDPAAARLGPTQEAVAAGAGPARIDAMPQAEARGDERFAADEAKKVITGQGGPSVAELQMRQGMQEAANAQLSAAAGARGPAAAAARRTALRNMARMQGNTAAQAALLRANEVAGARGQLASIASGTRAGDIGLASTQAQLEQEAAQRGADRTTGVSQFNAGQANTMNVTQAQLDQDAAQNAANRGLTAGVTDANNATGTAVSNAAQANQMATNQGQLNLTAAQGNQSTQQARNLAQGQTDLSARTTTANNQTQTSITNAAQANDVNAGNANRVITGRQVDDTNATNTMRTAGDLANQTTANETGRLELGEKAKDRRVQLVTGVAKSAAGAVPELAKLSDEDEKEDVAELSPKEIQAFLRSIKPKSFSYKDPEMSGAGEGRQGGVMAQDVEDTPLGDRIVKDTPNGKMLDAAEATGPTLAALRYLNDRLDALEHGKRSFARSMRNG